MERHEKHGYEYPHNDLTSAKYIPEKCCKVTISVTNRQYPMQIPRWLFSDSLYADMSPDAREACTWAAAAVLIPIVLLVPVECGDPGHFAIGQRKVENRDVLPDMIRVA